MRAESLEDCNRDSALAHEAQNIGGTLRSRINKLPPRQPVLRDFGLAGVTFGEQNSRVEFVTTTAIPLHLLPGKQPNANVILGLSTPNYEYKTHEIFVVTGP